MEALMHDGQALQSGTSHNLGQHFTKAFDKMNTTETANAFILSYVMGNFHKVNRRHYNGDGDNSGLVLLPKIAPIQIIIVPFASIKKAYWIKLMK
jgi:prolyl-tRNA synthetase